MEYNGGGFIVAGNNGLGSRSDWVEEYSMTENIWNGRQSTPRKMEAHSAVTFRNAVLIFGE